MERRLWVFTVLVALAVPAAAGARSVAFGVAIRGSTVNGDHSVTIAYELDGATVTSGSIAVDGGVVGGVRAGATFFTTSPLSAGWHTITIMAREIFETYTPPSGSTCEVRGGHWLCVRTWLSSIRVDVPAPIATCVVPYVVGLQLRVAKVRIRDAGCSMGAVTRVHSKRRPGTVLTQQPKKARRRLDYGSAVRLAVSSARA